MLKPCCLLCVLHVTVTKLAVAVMITPWGPCVALTRLGQPGQKSVTAFLASAPVQYNAVHILPHVCAAPAILVGWACRCGHLVPLLGCTGGLSGAVVASMIVVYHTQ